MLIRGYDGTIIHIAEEPRAWRYVPPAAPLPPEVAARVRLRQIFKGDEVGFEKYQARVRSIEQRWDAIGGPTRLSRYHAKQWEKFFRRVFVGRAR